MKQKDIPAATVLTFTILSVTFILASAAIFSVIEDDWDFVTALYFVIITMSTIGYGDVFPNTNLSKILTIVFIYISLFILFAIFQAIIHYCINKQVNRVKERIYRRVNRAVADQSLLEIEDENDHLITDNKCLNTIYNLCNSTSAIFLYIILYVGWLTLWIFYFTKWNKFQSKQYNLLNAIYFAVATSSTVGYGDFVPFEYEMDEDNTTTEFESHDNTNEKLFTLGMSIIGVVLLATLAGKTSTIMINLLITIFRFDCCKCCNFESNESELDGMQLSKETILNIKKNGAIDLRTFLAIQYSKDDEFVKKLENGCDLFDRYDKDGNKAIEFEELKKEYRKQRQIKTQQILTQQFLIQNDNAMDNNINDANIEMIVPDHSNERVMDL